MLNWIEIKRLREGKSIFVSIFKNRRAQAAAKRLGIEPKETVQYTGFGYRRIDLRVTNEEWKEIEKEMKPKAKKKTAEEKKKIWIKRLAKLAEISEEEAEKIANEKEEYHEDRLADLYEKQSIRRSRAREEIIKKLERENPLKKIKDENHARAVILASERHNNTDYEELLKEGKELREEGIIEDVKKFARINKNN